MNILGTHDTERALTVLAGGAGERLGPGVAGLSQPVGRAAGSGAAPDAAGRPPCQYCLPGVPCVYYGDEAGMEGYKDPFNRGCYPGAGKTRACLSGIGSWGSAQNLPGIAGRAVPAAACRGRRGRLPAAGRRQLPALRGQPRRGGKDGGAAGEWQGRTVNLGGGWIAEDTLHLPPEDCAICIRDVEQE